MHFHEWNDRTIAFAENFPAPEKGTLAHRQTTLRKLGIVLLGLNVAFGGTRYGIAMTTEDLPVTAATSGYEPA